MARLPELTLNIEPEFTPVVLGSANGDYFLEHERRFANERPRGWLRIVDSPERIKAQLEPILTEQVNGETMEWVIGVLDALDDAIEAQKLGFGAVAV